MGKLPENNGNLHRGSIGIQAVFGHLKSDFGLRRNMLKGIESDAANAWLAAAAFYVNLRLHEIKAIFLAVIQPPEAQLARNICYTVIREGM